MECVSENDVVCEDVQTPSVSSVEDSEERKEVSGGPGEQLEEEDVQCSDGGSGRGGDDVDEERVDEKEDVDEIGEEIGEELGEHVVEDGSEEQLEDAEELRCHEVDLDYGDRKGEIVEEQEEKEGLEERQEEELDDEDNPKRSESSEVSCLDSDSEETSQHCSTRDNFSESGVRKEWVPKVRHRKVRRSG